MKITIYELLGMIKDDIVPAKIKYDGTIYEYDSYKGDAGYVDKTQNPYKWFEKEIDCDVKQYLDDEVEIIEEPFTEEIEELPIKYEWDFENRKQKISQIPDETTVVLKVNEIIRKLKEIENENN